MSVLRRSYKSLLLDLISASEHAVNAREIIGTREYIVGLAEGGIVLLEMGFLTKVAHLDII